MENILSRQALIKVKRKELIEALGLSNLQINSITLDKYGDLYILAEDEQFNEVANNGQIPCMDLSGLKK